MPENRIAESEASKLFIEEMRRGLQTEGARPFRNDGRTLDPYNSLADFIRQVFGLEPARHHMVWIRALENEAEYPRLLIICPPGHAKTTVCGIAYPAWKIGRDIGRHWLYYGNTSTQATKQSVAIRDLMLSDAYQAIFPNVKRHKTKGWASDQWYLARPNDWDKDATMFALGVDGPALGARADEFIFDDVSDVENTATEAQRKKTREKVVAVAFTRQGGKSRKSTRMVAVMTRWHEDDLAATFEEQGFKLIWMPALGYWEYIEPLGQITLADITELPEVAELEDGSPLWPSEYDRDYFKLFQEKSPEIWLLEFQGLVTKPGGTLWKEEHFPVWDGELEGAKRFDPHGLRGIFQIWDTASRAGVGHDFWVCETWAWCADGYYMLEVYQGHHDFVTGIQRIRLHGDRLWSFADPDRATVIQSQMRAGYIEVNGTNNGQAAIDTLNQERRAFYPLQAVDSKEERAGQAVLALADMPCYYPAAPAAYVGTTRQEFILQHLKFPRAKHDDMADATAWSIITLRKYPVMPEDAWQARMTINERIAAAPTRSPYQAMFGTPGRITRTARIGGGYSDPAIPS